MSHSTKNGLKFFYIVALSLKTYYRDKSVRDNLLSIWSLSLILLYTPLISVPNMDPKADITNQQVKLLLLILNYFTCFGALTILILVVKHTRDELKFWQLAEDFEEISKLKLGILLDHKTFNRKTTIKIVVAFVVFVMCEVPPLIYSVVYPNELLFKSILFAFVPKTICRILNTKYIFYVDVLNFYMQVIEWRLAKKQITMSDMKTLRKCYTLCWKMCTVIEDIFGWSMCINGILKILSGVFCGYVMCIDYSNGHLNHGPLAPLIALVISAFLSAKSCQNCVSCSSSIAALIFSINSTEYRKIVESFGLQIMHQRIVFEPKGFYVVDNKYVLNVSISNRI